ncbi:MAG: S8 family serine peptidase [Verrucomicrobia bacterium]|nr:S8 family serine peptidase [Verrucomicrobiota bacterium]
MPTTHPDGRYGRLLQAAWMVLILVSGSLSATAAAPENSPTPAPALRWESASNRVDARITGWPLTRVLGRIAAATGWEVFVEPGQDRPIRATFTDLPPREALTRLLGGLNFSLQPQPGGASRLLIYQSDRDQATRRIAAPPQSGRIPNELVVRLKPGSGVSIEELAKLLGGEVVGQVASLNAYRLRFESAEAAEAARKKLESVREREGLAGVEDNYRWEPPSDVAADGTGQAATLPLKPRLSPDGKNLVVGIIDTAAQTLSPDREAFILSRTDIVSGQPADDGLWHGTAMAEAFLQGVTRTDNSEGGSTVRLRLYNAYGANEGATSFDVTRAVFQAAQDGVSVLSLSLGGPQGSPMLSDALASFVEQGGLVFVAAGNQGTDAPFYPAADASVIAVSAVNQAGERMPWANYGSYVDVGAPGVAVVPFGGQRWLVSGTSPATAMTAGMGAGYAARTGSPLSKARTVVLQQMPFLP